MHLRKVLWMAIALGALAARGEDLTTLQNVTYTNVKVQRHDREGLLVRHDGGETKIPFNAILPELRSTTSAWPAICDAGQGSGPLPNRRRGRANDLEVRGGRIYRNVVVRKVESYAVQLDHDGGSVKVYFTDIPDKDARDRVRTAVPVPVEPPGPDDFVTLDGQIFRRVEVLRTEPDGLTFRHAGGVTKRRFASLPEDVRKRYGYDPEAEKEVPARPGGSQEARPGRRSDAPGSQEVPIRRARADRRGRTSRRRRCQTRKLPNQEYQVSFTVQNRTDQLLFIRTIPYDAKMKALAGGKKFKIQPQSKGEQLDLVVPLVAPSELRIYCGISQTNRALRWWKPAGSSGTPERDRTSDLRFRKPPLCPTELPGQGLALLQPQNGRAFKSAVAGTGSGR